MFDKLIETLYFQFKDIPLAFFYLAIILLGVALFRSYKKHNHRFAMGMILIEYLFLVFCSTVFCRPSQPEVSHLELVPFWNYKEYFENNNFNTFWEIVFNIFLFFPIGLLLPFVVLSKHPLALVLVTTFCLSVSIESMQYLLHRGWCETDDVLHNLLGALFGFGAYKFVVSLKMN